MVAFFFLPPNDVSKKDVSRVNRRKVYGHARLTDEILSFRGGKGGGGGDQPAVP